MTRPFALRSGATETFTARVSPSLRRQHVSCARTVSPSNTGAVSAMISSTDSRIGGRDPITSSAVQPKSSSHAWFQTCTVPAPSTARIGSGDDCTMARNAASLRRRAASIARRSVMSRDSAEKYSYRPLASRWPVTTTDAGMRRSNPRTSISPAQRPNPMIESRISASISGVVSKNSFISTRGRGSSGPMPISSRAARLA